MSDKIKFNILKYAGARSADAVAHKDCEIVEIDETRFKYMSQNNADFALDVMRVVASRMRDRIADLERLRRKA